MEAIQILKGYLESLNAGRPFTHENLTLFPVTDGHSQALAYMLLEEALATGKLRVMERGEGTVPELQLFNETDRMVFLMDGEALVGAKQNRTLNTSILAGSHSSFDIPVSCVEQGRWAFAQREMRHGSITYPELRKVKHRSVHESLHSGGSYRSDQGRIWQNVRGKLASMEVGSATANMEEVYSAHESPILKFTENLGYPADACGVIAAIDGAIVCADLFDSASTLEKLWPRLVSSYAMDALEATLRQRQARTPDSTDVTEKQASEFLRIPEDAEIEAFPSPGLGHNVRYRHRSCSGHALIHEGTAVHTAMFGPETPPDTPQRPISRPSRRRRSF